MIGVNLQTSFLDNPPFGFSLFYTAQGLLPDSISTMMIYRGAVPSWGCRSGDCALFPFPGIWCFWLPSILF